MLLKKIALIGTTLGVLALPVVASATTLYLHTINNSSSDSTVYIPFSKKCSSSLGEAGITRANGGHQDTAQLGVKGICGNLAGGPCVANLYPNASCAGDPIGTITIDTVTMQITSSDITDPRFAPLDVKNQPGSGTTVTISNK